MELAEQTNSGSDHTVFERKLADLAVKVDRARNNPAIEALEARLNQVTSKLSATERVMTPQTEFNQVKHEVGKLRSEIGRAQEPAKPNVVQAIEARLKTLDSEVSGIRATAASSNDVKMLGDRLESVVARLNASEPALQSVERLDSFEDQLHSINHRLESSLSDTRPHPQISATALEKRERLVFERAASEEVPIAWVLAGGYTWGDTTMDELVDLHWLTIDAAANASTTADHHRNTPG